MICDEHVDLCKSSIEVSVERQDERRMWYSGTTVVLVVWWLEAEGLRIHILSNLSTSLGALNLLHARVSPRKMGGEGASGGCGCFLKNMRSRGALGQ